MPKNTQPYTITGVEAVPKEIAKTGTITTSGVDVLGDSTLFSDRRELKVGDFIFDPNQLELRRIVNILRTTPTDDLRNQESDIQLIIEEPFTADIVAPLALEIVEQSRVRGISLSNTGGNPATVDGNPHPAGLSRNWSKDLPRRYSANKDFLDPIAIDATGTSVEVSLTY